MPIFDNIVELLHTAGGGAGTVGGVLVGVIYKRFRASEVLAKLASKRSEEARSQLEDLAKDLRELKQSVKSQFAAIARGSSAKVEFTLDAESSDRIARLEAAVVEFRTRVSSLEDDFDQARKEDKSSWEEMQRALGRIEGALAVRFNKS
jgi:chromosome segregation ATPase